MAVGDAKAGLEALRRPLDAIQNAAGFRQDLGAFLIGIALSKELLEDRARVALLGQRLCGRAPRQFGAALRGREFERRQSRLLANVAGRNLVATHPGIWAALAEVPRLHARQPALF